MPLEFLRRKPGGKASSKAGSPEPPPEPISTAVPEEAVAQEHQLRLNFGAKTSTGVRLQGGPQLLAALPQMLAGVAMTGVEVVEPRVTALAVAAPYIIRTEEASEWLRAHGGASPITRHALYVLEYLDAIDPAYDTFACALLDGTVDPSGYPDYSAVVGGVAAHWDESTGDLIVRAVVGWGGRGARGDTDRIATRLLQRLLGSILESGEALGLTGVERPGAMPGGPGVTCQHCGYPAVHPRAVYCPKCGMRMHG
ncbi:MAG TPA: zinc ribbon domain-containing protein [Candidatus Limnocylindria bacterium]|nr:zinc ribbon domain-containing protein [Candidatus Limnocylindria bacterium]